MFFKKKLLSETKFSEKFSNELKKRVIGLEIISINELEIKTKLGNKEGSRHFLNNSYSEYLKEPKSINEIIERYVIGASDVYNPKDIVKIENILPIIKDKRFIEELKRINSGFEKSHIFESYNNELFIFYAEDKENSIHYISREDLLNIDFSEENLKTKSLENLNNLITIERHGENGLYMLTAGGNYESSLILLDIWNNENFVVNGEIIIGIPARDVLYVTGSKDSENLHKLYDVIKDINETGNHIVSDKLFELRNGKFETL
jgi:uncharacterized protein YtpQ (UPF0354 family)